MSGEPEYLEEEDTDAVVGHVHRAKRKMALLIMAPVVAVIVLVAVWALFGQRSCGQRFWKGYERPTMKSKVPKSWVVNPGSSTATLEISVSERVNVWVDGKEMGPTEEVSVELEPGEHSALIKTRRGGEMSTTLTVKPGEVFKLFFNRDTKTIHLYRVGPGGETIEVP